MPRCRPAGLAKYADGASKERTFREPTTCGPLELIASNPPDSILQSILDKNIDPEPDQFFFNFAGRSGQFVMGPTSSSNQIKEIRTVPYQKLKIEPTFTGPISQWRITTEDGTRYTFSEEETTTDLSYNWPNANDLLNPDEFHASSWYLTEIRSPGGDVITLYYSTYNALHELNSSVEKFTQITGPGDPCVPAEQRVIARNEVLSLRLDSIKSAQHTVVFSSPAFRDDARSPSGAVQEPQLDLITIRTPAGAVIRRFQFEYDYFSGADYGRLRLKNVYEQAASGASLPPYTFAYNPQAFPSRSSMDQDHWGYWNGAGNTTLIPTVTTASGAVLPGADRSPDPEKMTVGSLTRITFPTGGYHEFEWEANDYGGIGPAGSQPRATKVPARARTPARRTGCMMS